MYIVHGANISAYISWRLGQRFNISHIHVAKCQKFSRGKKNRFAKS